MNPQGTRLGGPGSIDATQFDTTSGRSVCLAAGTGGRVDGWTARRELTGNAVWLPTCPPVYLSTLKQPHDLPARQPRHALRRRLFWQPGHGHDIPALGHYEPGTGRRAYLIDRDTESARAAELRGVVGERVLSLRHADRRAAHADRLQIRDRPVRFRRIVGALSAIDLPHDRVDLLLDRSVGRI